MRSTACGGLSGAAATVRVRQRAFVRGWQEAICGSTKAVRPRAFVLQGRRWRLGWCSGARLWSCGRWGVQFRQVWSAKLVRRCRTCAASGVFYPRALSSLQPTRAWPLSVPRDVSPPASLLVLIGNTKTAQTQLAAAMSPLTGEPRLRFRRALPHGAEIVEPLLSSSHSFLAPQYAIAAHRFCKSIGARRPCTRHQSPVNAAPPRSTSTVQSQVAVQQPTTTTHC